MFLCDFINKKASELEEEYREVNFKKAVNVQLSKNSCGENFLSFDTDMLKQVKEVNLSEVDEISGIPFNENGTKVTFEVKPPKKRKFVRKEFYLLWDNKKIK